MYAVNGKVYGEDDCPSEAGLNEYCSGNTCEQCWKLAVKEHEFYSTIPVKLTLPNAKPPLRANPTDAGADLFATVDVEIEGGDTYFMDLGVQMAIPEGQFGMIVARSGLGSAGIIPRNCVGIIDSKYRGNFKIMIENKSNELFKIGVGDRIAQLLILPVNTPSFNVVDELNMTGDRNGGFGSTGV